MLRPSAFILIKDINFGSSQPNPKDQLAYISLSQLVPHERSITEKFLLAAFLSHLHGAN